MNKFLEDVAYAMAEGPKDEAMPWVEAPRNVIEYINKGRLDGFDAVKYCLFNGVKIYEEGKREGAFQRDQQTIEERTFGKRV